METRKDVKSCIILVYYIDCSKINNSDVYHYLSEASNALRIENDDVIQYFLPVHDTDNRIECINPAVVSEDEYSKIKERLDEMQEKFEEFIKQN